MLGARLTPPGTGGCRATVAMGLEEATGTVRPWLVPDGERVGLAGYW